MTILPNSVPAIPPSSQVPPPAEMPPLPGTRQDTIGYDPLTSDQLALTQHARLANSLLFRPTRFISATDQEALGAIQAFCRDVADIADAQAATAWKQAALSNWRAEMARLFAGEPRRAVSQALFAPIDRYHLRCEDFLALIEGMATAARRDIRAPQEAELDLLMQRGAATVARLVLRIAGIPVRLTGRVAGELGRALALTDILLGLADDAAYHRLYLPRELLRAHRIFATLPSAVLAHPALPQVCGELALRAERHYIAADAALRDCGISRLRSVAFALHAHRSVLRIRVAQDWRHLDEPVHLSPQYEAGLMLRLSLFGR